MRVPFWQGIPDSMPFASPVLRRHDDMPSRVPLSPEKYMQGPPESIFVDLNMTPYSGEKLMQCSKGFHSV